MSGKTVAKSRRAGEQPVESGIHRAAKRAGIRASQPAPSDELDRADEEFDMLRAIADLAEQSFETGDGKLASPTEILREALRCAQNDFGLISEAHDVPALVYLRCEKRIDLALALAEYREQFGYFESDDARTVREAVEAEQARAAGGES
jgi:hypothetical protein